MFTILCLEIGDQPSNCFRINLIDQSTFPKGSLPFGGFFRQDMTGIGFVLFYFSSLGLPKSFSSTSIRFYFGHSFTFLNPHYQLSWRIRITCLEMTR